MRVLAAVQLTSDGTVSFSYDASGNLIEARSDTYQWDWNNRLSSATINGTSLEYRYDGEGLRTEKTVDGVATEYLWDRQQSVPLMVEDGDSAYLHADGVLAEVESNGTAHESLADGLGSVCAVSDSNGALTATASYDVFGDVRSQNGDIGSFGFTGEQRDPSTDMIYLRARYYQPILGRMASPDTVQPNAPGTQGYNLYAYVANNPTTWVDPTGHSVNLASYDEFLTFTGAGGLIRVFGYIAYVLNCVSSGACLEPGDASELRTQYGSASAEGVWGGTVQETIDAADKFPLSPRPETPQIDHPYSEDQAGTNDKSNRLSDVLSSFGDCELAIGSVLASYVATKGFEAFAFITGATGGKGAASGIAWAAPTVFAGLIGVESMNRSSAADDSIGLFLGAVDLTTSPFYYINVGGSLLNAGYQCVIRPFREGTVREQASGFWSATYDRGASGAGWVRDQIPSWPFD